MGELEGIDAGSARTLDTLDLCMQIGRASGLDEPKLESQTMIDVSQSGDRKPWLSRRQSEKPHNEL